MSFETIQNQDKNIEAAQRKLQGEILRGILLVPQVHYGGMIFGLAAILEHHSTEEAFALVTTIDSVQVEKMIKVANHKHTQYDIRSTESEGTLPIAPINAEQIESVWKSALQEMNLLWLQLDIQHKKETARSFFQKLTSVFRDSEMETLTQNYRHSFTGTSDLNRAKRHEHQLPLLLNTSLQLIMPRLDSPDEQEFAKEFIAYIKDHYEIDIDVSLS